MGFMTLTELKPGTRDAVILAQVIRKWDFVSNNDDETIFHVSIILADDKGNAMYAEIPKSEVHAKRNMVDVGKIYVISRFIVRTAKTSYMPFPARCMIEFTSYTKAELAKNPPDTFPDYVYAVTPFSQLDEKLRNDVNFLDVLGVLVDVQPPAQKMMKGQSKLKTVREIFLEDLEGIQIKLTLWGQRALDFDASTVYDPEKQTPIITLFVGCLPKSIQRITQLSGNNACHWYFNPNIPETQALSSRLGTRRFELPHATAKLLEGDTSSLIPKTDHRTLLELNAMDPYDFPNQGFQVTVTITKVPQNNEWWYPACLKCKKKMEQQDTGYYCFECDLDQVKFSYKLNFIAADGTDEAKFFCYDTVARQIVQRNCQALLNPSKRSSGFPPELAAIVSKKFTFAVGLTGDSFRSAQSRTYLVDAIVTRFDRQAVLPKISTASSSRLLSVGANLSEPIHAPQDILSGTDNAVVPSHQTPPPMIQVDATPTKALPVLDLTQDAPKHLSPKRLFQHEDQTDKSKEPADPVQAQSAPKRKKPTTQKTEGKTADQQCAAPQTSN